MQKLDLPVTIELAYVNQRIDMLQKMAVTPENAKKLEDLRTDTNKFIKGVLDLIEEKKEEYLAPFHESEEHLLSQLRPLMQANEDFAERILEAKKIAFEGKVKQRWEELCSLDLNGEIVPFNEVYDPKWYGKSEKVWLNALISAIKAYKQKGIFTSAKYDFKSISTWDLAKLDNLIATFQDCEYTKE